GCVVMAEHADRHEREQQRDGDIERAEGGDQHAVEGREAAGERRRLGGGKACLAIERDRLNEAVADERREQEQHRPQRAAAGDLPLLAKELWQIAGGRAPWTMLLLLCPLVGYSFVHAVSLSRAASRAPSQPPAPPVGLSR